MSLDVHLITDKRHRKPTTSGIFVRENGRTVEITEEEWNRRHPDREPVRLKSQVHMTNDVYHANITHNLGKMAEQAGIYEALWRPEEKGWKLAKDLIEPLEAGLEKLKFDPAGYQWLNPENGWGNYDLLVEFVEKYLGACQEWPEARIEVSR